MTVLRKTRAERLELLKQQKVDIEQKLKAKAQKIATRIKAIEAKDITQSRKNENHRKILLGAMIMDLLKKGELERKWILEKMDGFLTRDEERCLFALEFKNPVENDSTQAVNSVEIDLTDLDC